MTEGVTLRQETIRRKFDIFNKLVEANQPIDPYYVINDWDREANNDLERLNNFITNFKDVCDTYSEEELQNIVEKKQTFLNVVKERQEKLKKPVDLFNQATDTMREIHVLLDSYNKAEAIFQEIGREKNFLDYPEETLQNALIVLNNVLTALRLEKKSESGTQEPSDNLKKSDDPEKSEAELKKLAEELRKVYEQLSPEEQKEIDQLNK